ncbi:MAG: hypothetical protein QM501_03460 [Gimesia sp.]
MQIQSLEDRVLLTGYFTSDDIVVQTGDAAPTVEAGETNGTFNGFSWGPIINESGQALFQAGINNSLNPNDAGLFYTSSTGQVTMVARGKQSIPAIPGGTLDTGISFNTVSSIPLPFNDHGQAVFLDHFSGDSILHTENAGIFIGTSGEEPSMVVREGSDAPGAMNGSTNGKFGEKRSNYVTINNSAQIAFLTLLLDTDNGNTDNDVIFGTDTNGTLFQIVREGQSIPGASAGTFTSFNDPSINDAGQVAFMGFNNNNDLLDGIYVSNGNGAQLRVIAQEGDVFNSINEFFVDIKSTSHINAVGDVAFKSSVEDGFTGVRPVSVFVRSENGTLREVVRRDDILSNGETYLNNGNSIVLNNKGDVAFLGGSNANRLYRGDADASERGDIKEIARVGQTVPASDLVFKTLRKFALNDSRQIAFTATIWDGTESKSEREALFFYDDVYGLIEIVRAGDEVGGFPVSYINFAGNDHQAFLPSNGDGLNNNGQVTFSYQLENGNQGVAIVDFSERIDVRVVTSSTNVDLNGETSSLPDNQNLISEWSSYSVEI